MTLSDVIDTLQTWIRNADDEYDREEMGRVAGLKEALHEIKKIEPYEDAISRQDAIRWVKTECNPYGKPTLDFESGKKVMKHLEDMPPVQLVSRWIPVSERLPGEGEEVLVSGHDRYNKRVIISRYEGEQYGFTCGLVSAWMPLPKPYKTESEGEE